MKKVSICPELVCMNSLSFRHYVLLSEENKSNCKIETEVFIFEKEQATFPKHTIYIWPYIRTKYIYIPFQLYDYINYGMYVGRGN